MIQLLSIIEIIALTVAGVALALAGVDTGTESAVGLLTSGVLVFVSVWDAVVFRALVMPNLARKAVPRQNMEVVAYGQAGAAGVMAVVAALVSQSALAALPIGLVGLGNWLSMRSFFESQPVAVPVDSLSDAQA